MTLMMCVCVCDKCATTTCGCDADDRIQSAADSKSAHLCHSASCIFVSVLFTASVIASYPYIYILLMHVVCRASHMRCGTATAKSNISQQPRTRINTTLHSAETTRTRCKIAVVIARATERLDQSRASNLLSKPEPENTPIDCGQCVCKSAIV